MRGVRETTRRKVVVEGRDCDDWMAVDLGMVWYTQHNWISLSFSDYLPGQVLSVACRAMIPSLVQITLHSYRLL